MNMLTLLKLAAAGSPDRVGIGRRHSTGKVLRRELLAHLTADRAPAP
jgi:hypothetical protein